MTSFALGAALGLAWALADVRSAPIPLGKRIAPKGWPITFSLPVGWKSELQDADAWSGEIEARPADESGTLRMIIRHDRRYPSSRPRGIIQSYIGQRYSEDVEPRTAGEAISMGPVAGYCVSGQRLTAHMVYPLSIAAAGIPDGPAIVVELFARSGDSGAMRRIIRSVCESIEFVRPRLSRSLADLSGKAGFECAVPAGLWCVEESSEFLAGIGFVADSGNIAPWSARAWRTFLAEPRTLADLVSDQALSGAISLELPEKPSESAVGGRPTAHITYSQLGSCMAVWAIDLGAGCIVMVRGDGPESLSDEIEAGCRRMAETAQRRTSADEFDVAAAVKAGAEAVAAVRRRGLAPTWGDGSRSIWYLYERCGEPIGYLKTHRERESVSRNEGKPAYGYSGIDDSQVRFLDSQRIARHSIWTIDDDAVAFTLDQTLTDVYGDVSIVFKSRIARDSADAELDISASLEDGKRSDRLKVGDAFAASPISEVVIRQVAERGIGHQALIRMIDSPPFAAGYERCSVERGSSGERRVRTQSDFDPHRSLYAFDDDGELARLTLGGGIVIRRVKHADVARGLDWYGKSESRPGVKAPPEMENEE